MGKITEPKPLGLEHELSFFCCEELVLDNWLKNKALKNQYSGASRTFVVCDNNTQVIAFYSLATGSIVHKDTTGKVRRNIPNPIPIMLLGRLAVDNR